MKKIIFLPISLSPAAWLSPLFHPSVPPAILHLSYVALNNFEMEVHYK